MKQISSLLDVRSEVKFKDLHRIYLMKAKGAQILNGAVNNPITVICQQAGIIQMCMTKIFIIQDPVSNYLNSICY